MTYEDEGVEKMNEPDPEKPDKYPFYLIVSRSQCELHTSNLRCNFASTALNFLTVRFLPEMLPMEVVGNREQGKLPTFPDNYLLIIIRTVLSLPLSSNFPVCMMFSPATGFVPKIRRLMVS